MLQLATSDAETNRCDTMSSSGDPRSLLQSPTSVSTEVNTFSQEIVSMSLGSTTSTSAIQKPNPTRPSAATSTSSESAQQESTHLPAAPANSSEWRSATRDERNLHPGGSVLRRRVPDERDARWRADEYLQNANIAIRGATHMKNVTYVVASIGIIVVPTNVNHHPLIVSSGRMVRFGDDPVVRALRTVCSIDDTDLSFDIDDAIAYMRTVAWVDQSLDVDSGCRPKRPAAAQAAPVQGPPPSEAFVVDLPIEVRPVEGSAASAASHDRLYPYDQAVAHSHAKPMSARDKIFASVRTNANEKIDAAVAAITSKWTTVKTEVRDRIDSANFVLGQFGDGIRNRLPSPPPVVSSARIKAIEFNDWAQKKFCKTSFSHQCHVENDICVIHGAHAPAGACPFDGVDCGTDTPHHAPGGIGVRVYNIIDLADCQEWDVLSLLPTVLPGRDFSGVTADQALVGLGPTSISLLVLASCASELGATFAVDKSSSRMVLVCPTMDIDYGTSLARITSDHGIWGVTSYPGDHPAVPLPFANPGIAPPGWAIMQSDLVAMFSLPRDPTAGPRIVKYCFNEQLEGLTRGVLICGVSSCTTTSYVRVFVGPWCRLSESGDWQPDRSIRRAAVASWSKPVERVVTAAGGASTWDNPASLLAGLELEKDERMRVQQVLALLFSLANVDTISDLGRWLITVPLVTTDIVGNASDGDWVSTIATACTMLSGLLLSFAGGSPTATQDFVTVVHSHLINEQDELRHAHSIMAARLAMEVANPRSLFRPDTKRAVMLDFNQTVAVTEDRESDFWVLTINPGLFDALEAKCGNVTSLAAAFMAVPSLRFITPETYDAIVTFSQIAIQTTPQAGNPIVSMFEQLLSLLAKIFGFVYNARILDICTSLSKLWSGVNAVVQLSTLLSGVISSITLFAFGFDPFSNERTVIYGMSLACTRLVLGVSGVPTTVARAQEIVELMNTVTSINTAAQSLGLPPIKYEHHGPFFVAFEAARAMINAQVRPMPVGVLIVGPPKSGKTRAAEWLCTSIAELMGSRDGVLQISDPSPHRAAFIDGTMAPVPSEIYAVNMNDFLGPTDASASFELWRSLLDTQPPAFQQINNGGVSAKAFSKMVVGVTTTNTEVFGPARLPGLTNGGAMHRRVLATQIESHFTGDKVDYKDVLIRVVGGGYADDCRRWLADNGRRCQKVNTSGKFDWGEIVKRTEPEFVTTVSDIRDWTLATFAKHVTERTAFSDTPMTVDEIKATFDRIGINPAVFTTTTPQAGPRTGVDPINWATIGTQVKFINRCRAVMGDPPIPGYDANYSVLTALQEHWSRIGKYVLGATGVGLLVAGCLYLYRTFFHKPEPQASSRDYPGGQVWNHQSSVGPSRVVNLGHRRRNDLPRTKTQGGGKEPHAKEIAQRLGAKHLARVTVVHHDGKQIRRCNVVGALHGAQILIPSHALGPDNAAINIKVEHLGSVIYDGPPVNGVVWLDKDIASFTLRCGKLFPSLLRHVGTVDLATLPPATVAGKTFFVATIGPGGTHLVEKVQAHGITKQSYKRHATEEGYEYDVLTLKCDGWDGKCGSLVFDLDGRIVAVHTAGNGHVSHCHTFTGIDLIQNLDLGAYPAAPTVDDIEQDASIYVAPAHVPVTEISMSTSTPQGASDADEIISKATVTGIPVTGEIRYPKGLPAATCVQPKAQIVGEDTVTSRAFVEATGCVPPTVSYGAARIGRLSRDPGAADALTARVVPDGRVFSGPPEPPHEVSEWASLWPQGPSVPIGFKLAEAIAATKRTSSGGPLVIKIGDKMCAASDKKNFLSFLPLQEAMGVEYPDNLDFQAEFRAWLQLHPNQQDYTVLHPDAVKTCYYLFDELSCGRVPWWCLAASFPKQELRPIEDGVVKNTRVINCFTFITILVQGALLGDLVNAHPCTNIGMNVHGPEWDQLMNELLVDAGPLDIHGFARMNKEDLNVNFPEHYCALAADASGYDGSITLDDVNALIEVVRHWYRPSCAANVGMFGRDFADKIERARVFCMHTPFVYASYWALHFGDTIRVFNIFRETFGLGSGALGTSLWDAITLLFKYCRALKAWMLEVNSQAITLATAWRFMPIIADYGDDFLSKVLLSTTEWDPTIHRPEDRIGKMFVPAEHHAKFFELCKTVANLKVTDPDKGAPTFSDDLVGSRFLGRLVGLPGTLRLRSLHPDVIATIAAWCERPETQEGKRSRMQAFFCETAYLGRQVYTAVWEKAHLDPEFPDWQVGDFDDTVARYGITVTDGSRSSTARVVRQAVPVVSDLITTSPQSDSVSDADDEMFADVQEQQQRVAPVWVDDPHDAIKSWNEMCSDFLSERRYVMPLVDGVPLLDWLKSPECRDLVKSIEEGYSLLTKNPQLDIPDEIPLTNITFDYDQLAKNPSRTAYYVLNSLMYTPQYVYLTELTAFPMAYCAWFMTTLSSDRPEQPMETIVLREHLSMINHITEDLERGGSGYRQFRRACYTPPPPAGVRVTPRTVPVASSTTTRPQASMDNGVVAVQPAQVDVSARTFTAEPTFTHPPFTNQWKQPPRVGPLTIPQWPMGEARIIADVSAVSGNIQLCTTFDVVGVVNAKFPLSDRTAWPYGHGWTCDGFNVTVQVVAPDGISGLDTMVVTMKEYTGVRYNLTLEWDNAYLNTLQVRPCKRGSNQYFVPNQSPWGFFSWDGAGNASVVTQLSIVAPARVATTGFQYREGIIPGVTFVITVAPINVRVIARKLRAADAIYLPAYWDPTWPSRDPRQPRVKDRKASRIARPTTMPQCDREAETKVNQPAQGDSTTSLMKTIETVGQTALEVGGMLAMFANKPLVDPVPIAVRNLELAAETTAPCLWPAAGVINSDPSNFPGMAMDDIDHLDFHNFGEVYWRNVGWAEGVTRIPISVPLPGTLNVGTEIDDPCVVQNGCLLDAATVLHMRCRWDSMKVKLSFNAGAVSSNVHLVFVAPDANWPANEAAVMNGPHDVISITPASGVEKTYTIPWGNYNSTIDCSAWQYNFRRTNGFPAEWRIAMFWDGTGSGLSAPGFFLTVEYHNLVMFEPVQLDMDGYSNWSTFDFPDMSQPVDEAQLVDGDGPPILIFVPSQSRVTTAGFSCPPDSITDGTRNRKHLDITTTVQSSVDDGFVVPLSESFCASRVVPRATRLSMVQTTHPQASNLDVPSTALTAPRMAVVDPSMAPSRPAMADGRTSLRHLTSQWTESVGEIPNTSLVTCIWVPPGSVNTTTRTQLNTLTVYWVNFPPSLYLQQDGGLNPGPHKLGERTRAGGPVPVVMSAMPTGAAQWYVLQMDSLTPSLRSLCGGNISWDVNADLVVTGARTATITQPVPPKISVRTYGVSISGLLRNSAGMRATRGSRFSALDPVGIGATIPWQSLYPFEIHNLNTATLPNLLMWDQQRVTAMEFRWVGPISADITVPSAHTLIVRRRVSEGWFGPMRMIQNWEVRSWYLFAEPVEGQNTKRVADDDDRSKYG